jgi:hypothetical protein
MLSTVRSFVAPPLLRPMGRTLALRLELGVKMMVMIGKKFQGALEFLMVNQEVVTVQ